MGWSSGSELMVSVIHGVRRKNMTRATRRRVYEVLIPLFERHDCDTLAEAAGIDPTWDAVAKRLHVAGMSDEE